ncbi:MAG: Flp family type IVb pilin [Planctomycetes bacterium]|nr:Flp family type IVb pilin [Planctomycetota bacterium]
MKALWQKGWQFLRRDDGPTAVEYAVMLALIVVVCMTAVRSIGTRSKSTFQKVAKQLHTSSS